MTEQRNPGGFTLVEMLSIILLLGIISVVVVSRVNLNPLRTAGFSEELLSAIRFAQKFAIVSGCEVQVDINAAADSYALTLRSDVNPAIPTSCLTAVAAFGMPLRNPIGGNFAGNAPNGVDITTGLTFFYGRDGRPSGSGSITVDGRNISVEALSGYAHH